MPFISGEELDQLREQAAQAGRLQQELDIARAAGGLVTQIEGAITTFSQTGALEQAAVNAARIHIETSERDRVVTERTDALVAEERDEFAAAYRREKGPEITRELDTMFSSDGTYAHARSEAEAKAQDTIRAELLEAEKARVAEELNAPEAKKAAIDRIRPEVVNSHEMRDFRERTRSDLENGWRAEVATDVEASIINEETASEAAFKQRYEGQYRETPKVDKLRRATVADLQRKWSNETEETVNSAVQDEELTRLLEEKTEQAKEKLARENKANELLAAFEGGGIEVSSIESGSNIIIDLGEISDTHPNGYSHGRGSKPFLQLARRLTMHALGANRFRVRADSLQDSKSPWERSLAIHDGTIIVIGNLQSENGEQSLEPRICAGAHLHYDDDTTTPATFIGMAVPVANVTINGIPARKLQEA